MENSYIDYNHKSIQMKNITKKFGDFVANDNINLTVHKGEVHALLGENGAGKSTLMNILYGLYTPTSGEIYINEELVNIENPSVAISKGIGMVHQHFMLIGTFTVAQNIILGSETTKFMGALDMNKAIKDVEEISKRYGLAIDPMAKVDDISVGMQQRVEILKALYRGAETLILDEPTAGLDPKGRDEIFNLIKTLHREKNMTIILSSHSMDDMAKIAKTIIVMNHGKIEFMGTPREIFNNHAPRLREIGLDIPQVLELAIKLKDKGFDIRTDVLTIDEIKEEVLNFMKGRKRC